MILFISFIILGSFLMALGYFLQYLCVRYSRAKVNIRLPFIRTLSTADENKPIPLRLIAHRGTRLEGLPENSIAAYKYALKTGDADVIECDVWLSEDKEVIVFHDENLSRMTGVDNKTTSLNSKALPTLKTNISGQSERCESGTEYRIPTLGEVLQVLDNDKALIIEFKQNSLELIQKVHNIIHAYKKETQVIWFSLDEKINKQLREYDPLLPTINSILGMLKTLLFYYLGILPFVDIPDAIFGITVEEITLETVRHEKALAGAPDFVKKILAWLFQGRPPKLMIATNLFKHLRMRGHPVWFLGVNNETDLRLAVSTGATGVLTDRPRWLSTTMREEKLKFKNLFE